jgi:hypothetical protein
MIEQSQRSILKGKFWVALLALAVGASWGCGGGNASAGGPTPTPTPTPVPTPTPTPPPLPAGTIGLKVLDTSVPPGGIFQFQLSNTEPKPIGHGSTRPQVPSGPVRGVAVNDPSGQAAGIAVVNGPNIAIKLSSPDATPLLGTNITYPIVTMSMPLTGVSAGQTFPISIDTANTLFDDATKNYALEFAPGTLTIAPAGSPYVSDVLPAGGLLPDRTLIKIFGAGFNANTRVSIEGTTIVPADQNVVSANEVDVKICNGTVADGAATCPNTGAMFQLDGERVRVKDTNTNFVLEYYTYLRADNVTGSSATPLVNLVHPMFSRVTYLSATIPLVTGGTQFTGLSLQNTNAADSGIKIELLDANNASLANTTFILPGLNTDHAGNKITRDVVADWFPSPPSGAAKVRVTVTSGPAVQVLGMLGDTSTGTVSPVIPQ